MAITGHTGIPPFLNVFATPSVSIAATTEAPYCSGADVTFNATIVAPALQYLNTYYFTINGITASGKVLTMTTNSLVDGDVVRFVMVHKNGSVYYSNSIVAAVELCINYGLLYNWYAATDVRNITSAGDFIVPSKVNWETLLDYIDDYDEVSGRWNLAGGLLKSIGLDFWNTPNEGAVNSYNFNARGAGGRQFEGVFGAGDTVIKEFSGFISKSEYDIDNIWTTVINNLYADASVITNSKKDGLSIRLVRPATESEQLLADGTACEHYIGNDGKIYRTVKIGTQVWIASNLAETKFRNGEYLHGYEGGSYQAISDVDWSNLVSEGVCCYNDDINLI